MTAENKGPTNSADRKEFIPPQPSDDLAWILGVFSVAGSIRERAGEVKLATRDIHFIESVEDVGRSIFDIEPFRYESDYNLKNPRRRSISYTTYFLNKDLCRYFGDMSKKNWVDTVTNRHSWIFDEENYIDEYLSGIFDARGSVQKRANPSGKFYYNINISIAKERGGIFVGQLLNEIGMTNVRLYNNHTENNLGVVRLQHANDILNFVSRVKSRVVSKEEMLKRCREVVAGNLPTERMPNLSDISDLPLETSDKSINEKARIEEILATPSHELSWLIGLIVAGGNVHKSGRITLMSKQPEVLQQFPIY
jgi:hypothetical protein